MCVQEQLNKLGQTLHLWSREERRFPATEGKTLPVFVTQQVCYSAAQMREPVINELQIPFCNILCHFVLFFLEDFT